MRLALAAGVYAGSLLTGAALARAQQQRAVQPAEEEQPQPTTQDPAPQPRHAPGMHMPMYDTSTEATFRGTVQSVEAAAPSPGRMSGGMHGMGGTHVLLKTASGTLAVHLGPSSYLNEQNVRIQEGDEIEVIGSRIRLGSEEFVLARQVTRGDDTWTLRDASGRPMWGRGRMRP